MRGALKVCRWVSPQEGTPNHGDTETRRKAIKKTPRLGVSVVSLLSYLQLLSAPKNKGGGARVCETTERAENLRFSLYGLSDLFGEENFTHTFRHSQK